MAWLIALNSRCKLRLSANPSYPSNGALHSLYRLKKQERTVILFLNWISGGEMIFNINPPNREIAVGYVSNQLMLAVQLQGFTDIPRIRITFSSPHVSVSSRNPVQSFIPPVRLRKRSRVHIHGFVYLPEYIHNFGGL